jgi:hypothetical protein
VFLQEYFRREVAKLKKEVEEIKNGEFSHAYTSVFCFFFCLVVHVY